MDAREDLPKISIETEQDWRRIQQNLTSALLVRLDSELESHGRSADKDALLAHAHQFLETVFDITRPNLRVNGRTADEPCDDEDDVEPFDEALDRHIWSLSDQRLKWDKEIADCRRSRPDAIKEMVLGSLTQHEACGLDVRSESNTCVDVHAEEIDSTLRQTLQSTLSLVSYLSEAIESQQCRVDMVKSVSAEVKALKS